MDGDRFDALTRTLAQGRSRRQLLRGLGGGLAALGLGLAAERPAAAVTCRPLGYLCGKHAHCCSGVCDAKTNRCTCPPGQTSCAGTCSALGSDVTNCGACGKACPAPARATATCTNGTCGFTCDEGFADCNGTASDGCETRLFSDPNNCGACGRSCSAPANASPLCISSECGFVCAGGMRPCGEGCIPAGSCCTVSDCAAGQVCANGTCKDDIICPAGSMICSETSYPTCCGPQTFCNSVGGEDYCCSAAGGQTNWCTRCPNSQFACCSQNADVNDCVCCTAGQTCNNSSRLPACSG